MDRFVGSGTMGSHNLVLPERSGVPCKVDGSDRDAHSAITAVLIVSLCSGNDRRRERALRGNEAREVSERPEEGLCVEDQR